MMKKYIIGGLIGFVLATAASANAEGVTKLIDQVVQGVFPVTVEGTSIGDAVVIDNKTYLPVREFGEAVGYKVTFTEDREVVLTKNIDSTVPKAPQTTPVPEQPAKTVNPRIAQITKELDEWNVKLKYVNDKLSDQNKLISDLESKLKSEDTLVSRDAQGSLDFQRPVLEGMKENKQYAESEITKLQDELKILQFK